MAVANFEELCAGFCEIAGLDAPQLKSDQRGLVAFHTVFRGVTVDVMHWPDLCGDKAFVLFDFGPIPGHVEVKRLRALLRANFLPFQQTPGIYGCNPATGDVMLQYALPLFETTAHNLLELVEDGVERASRWRERCGTSVRTSVQTATEEACK
jgi:hypothetical protein